MNSVLVGMFDTEADALAARGKLVAAGFAAERAADDRGSASAATPTSATSTPRHRAASRRARITRFFENLFGSDDSDDDRNSTVTAAPTPKRSSAVRTA